MPWTRPVATGLVVLTALTCGAPAFAGERRSGAQPGSLTARVAASVAKLPPTSQALMAQAPAPTAGTPDSARSFFRTPKGIAALVLMVAAAGYVAYKIPKDNEQVHSPIR
jgi:hypothetical protein